MNLKFPAATAALFLISLTLHGQETKESPTPTVAPKSETVLLESPKGSYRLEKGPNEYSAWVVSTKNSKQRQLLSLAPDDSIDPDSCAASPDEKWLVMREELYQRAGPVKFVAFRKKGWFKTKLYQFVDNTIHPSSRHWIWSLGEWSTDSDRLTVSLSWPDEGEANIFFNTHTNEFEKN